MFIKILTFELKYWFKNPVFYIYCGCVFLFSLMMMTIVGGLFDNITVTRSSITNMDSALAINALLEGLNQIVYFLLPSIIGVTIVKDFSSETSNVLYSYPFTKVDYLFGKFTAGIIVSFLVMLFIGLGFIVGTVMPGTNPEMFGGFRLMNYVQPYLIYVIPNLIFFGAVIFGIVTFSRNIISGFIFILVLFLFQNFSQGMFNNMDNKELAALLNPFGSSANNYYSQYWTATEQNENLLPIEDLVIYNRLIWSGLGIIIFAAIFFAFSFSQNAFQLSYRKVKGERVTKNNFGSMVRLDLPSLSFNYSFLQNLKNAWYLSRFDFMYVLKSWPFIIISIIGLLFLMVLPEVSAQIYGTSIYPITSQVINQAYGLFSLVVILPMTYLYMGMLMKRSTIAKADQLVDITPTPNWTFLLSKMIAIVKVQVFFSLLIMLAGIILQTYQGFYEFEIGLYLFDLLAVRIWNVIIWTFLAIFIQTLIPNYIVGFIVTLALAILIGAMGAIGVEQDIFKYNSGPGFSYSEMNGYGHSLSLYYLYKGYWLLLGIVFYVIGIAFWRRGVPTGFKNWFNTGVKNFTLPIRVTATLSLISFLAVGVWIYYTNNIEHERTSSKENELNRVENEKLYSKYDGIIQPRIVDVKIDLDLVPETRDLKVKGRYYIKNKSDQPIDSIHVNHTSGPAKFSFDRKNDLVLEDTVFNYDIYALESPLLPGDSMIFNFDLWNEKNTLLRNNSPVLYNGTFLNNGSFPSFGYSRAGELEDNKVREKYELPPRERMKSPFDSANLENTYISQDADWINFETTISTTPDQIAIAPGYLQKEWEENGRRYFHYKMDSKMLNFYAFLSAKYEVKKDKINDVNIEIYYHKGHDYNLDRMINGVKKSLTYYEANYSPYQHKQLRILEFPRTFGSFAQSFANTIPYSEAIGFIAKVDDEDQSGVDYPFTITAHEVAHQWWAHQVIGANVQGATVMSESMSHYSCLKVLEKEHGKEQMRVFLKDELDKYLLGRATERLKEKPLMFNENQQYIHYRKGSVILYALSDLIGEDNMHKAIKKYLGKVAFQEAPYTTSVEFVSFLREATPDSMQYLIKDMFETITLYDNKVEKATYKELEDGKFEVNINSLVSKYRANEKGKRVFKNESGDSLTFKIEGRTKPLNSLPLADWIEVGIFTKKEVDGKNKEVPLYLKKHKFSEISNNMTIIVDEKPVSVGIDPYNKLIDTNSNDNRRDPEEVKTE